MKIDSGDQPITDDMYLGDPYCDGLLVNLINRG
jgi:hypothetical protein